MRESEATGPIHPGVGTAIVIMLGVVAVTPLTLALAAARNGSSFGTMLFAAAATLWALVFIIYRAVAHAHQVRRRQILQQELSDIRRARIEASDAFQDRLNDHYAILDRIGEISETLIDEGIIDPQLALRTIGLIGAHARDAQIQIEDSIIEVRVETGAQEASIETIDARDEVEQVVAPFVRSGINVATSGPRHFAKTDPAMFRLIIRSLVTSAVDREADDIDVSIGRDNDTVVCTVSDNGPDCSRLGLGAVSALAMSLAGAADTKLRFLRVLGRNQFSVETEASEPPDSPDKSAPPMDVLGVLPQSQPRVEPAQPSRRTYTHEELITFLEDQERDRKHSVAARREHELLAR